MSNILVMEDDPDQGALLVEGLRQAGHTVTLTKIAHEAWSQLILRNFDVLITDIFVRNHQGKSIRGQGGIALIERVRQQGKGGFAQETRRNVKIIAITGGGFVTDTGHADPLKAAHKHGADAVLQKPATLAKILSTIDELVTP